jgi:hypothetical protein
LREDDEALRSEEGTSQFEEAESVEVEIVKDILFCQREEHDNESGPIRS